MVKSDTANSFVQMKNKLNVGVVCVLLACMCDGIHSKSVMFAVVAVCVCVCGVCVCVCGGGETALLLVPDDAFMYVYLTYKIVRSMHTYIHTRVSVSCLATQIITQHRA